MAKNYNRMNKIYREVTIYASNLQTTPAVKHEFFPEKGAKNDLFNHLGVFTAAIETSKPSGLWQICSLLIASCMEKRHEV